MTAYLVGAGPGDPGLLTARALELIARADVILARPPDPARGARARPRRRGGRRRRARSAAASRCPSARRRGCWSSTPAPGAPSCASKGGDPFVFGRGGEEAQALRAAGCDYEVVPGVTAGVAAPAYAGIPVTQRGMASAVAFVTGPRGPGQAGDGDRLGGARGLPGHARLLHGRAPAAAHRRAARSPTAATPARRRRSSSAGRCPTSACCARRWRRSATQDAARARRHARGAGRRAARRARVVRRRPARRASAWR